MIKDPFQTIRDRKKGNNSNLHYTTNTTKQHKRFYFTFKSDELDNKRQH